MKLPGGGSDKECACQRRRFKEMWVRSLGREDPLEEGMATHSSILAWFSMDRGAWQATVHGAAQSWTRLKRPGTHMQAFFIAVSLTAQSQTLQL